MLAPNLAHWIKPLSSVAAAVGLLLLAAAATELFEGWVWQWAGRRERQGVWLSPAGSHKTPKLRPGRGTVLATLEIARLRLSVVVLEGSDDAVLKRGPGHIEDTAYPGEAGNVAIAGHRDTHFRPLRNIEIGDAITLTTQHGRFQYYVDSAEIIEPTEMTILDPTPGPALTLVTCYPFDFVGNAPKRFIIHATPRDGKASANRPAHERRKIPGRAYVEP